MTESDLKTLANLCIQRAKTNKKQFVTVESCTGGLISKIITDVAGASAAFYGGFITYANQSKTDAVGVSPDTLEMYGAVSAQTAKEMAAGALKNTPADYAVSVTGIAGPDTSPSKPIGLVYIGVCQRDGEAKAYKHNFSGDRAAIRLQSAQAALKYLLELMA